jgi:deoxyribose-phosphate aldolase
LATLASRVADEGGKEIDIVVNVSRVLSGKWEFVKAEIEKVNAAVVERGAILKVIFENDCEYRDPLIIRDSMREGEGVRIVG